MVPSCSDAHSLRIAQDARTDVFRSQDGPASSESVKLADLKNESSPKPLKKL